jgi:L-cysteine desulfidase
MELTLRQKEPVQLDHDLRCHDLIRRLQLYRQIAGKAVLQHAANRTPRSGKCQLPVMTIVGST